MLLQHNIFQICYQINLNYKMEIIGMEMMLTGIISSVRGLDWSRLCLGGKSSSQVTVTCDRVEW